MLRFLLSLIIIWAIIWGLFNFFSPLNQLSRTIENTQKESFSSLREALTRSGIDTDAVNQILWRNNTGENEEITEDFEEVSDEDTAQRVPRDFGKWDRNSQNNKERSPENGVNTHMLAYETKFQAQRNEKYSNNSLSKIHSTPENGQKGFFGTPPLPEVSTWLSRWGIIFDPLFNPPSLERQAVWFFGDTVIRRDFQILSPRKFFSL